MRRLIGVLVVLAILAAGLAVADVWVRHRVQSLVATHVESQLPGSTATANISSFPFLGRLATSGTVPKLTVAVKGVTSGGLTFSTIDVTIYKLKIERNQLSNERVVLQSIGSGSVVAQVTQASIDQVTGLSVILGSGTVSLDGLTLHPKVSVAGTIVTLSVPDLPPVHLTVPAVSILPCVGAASVTPGALQLSCQITTLPPVLRNFSAKF